jgi:type I restriction enzyme S subunit
VVELDEHLGDQGAVDEASIAAAEAQLQHIPADWRVAPLGNVVEITMGQSPPSTTYNEEGQGLPFLQGKAEFGARHPRPMKWCSSPLKVVSKGTILMSVRAPVGDVNIAATTCCIGRGLAGLKAHAADPDFVFYALMYLKPLLEAQGSGTTFQSINRGVLRAFPIPLPPFPEQRAIAHALRAVQRAREATEAVIAATRELKQALLRHLFTYGPVPVEQADRVVLRETEIGPVPAHWKVVRLGEVSEKPQYGYTTSAADAPIGPKFLRITDIQDGGVNWATVPFCECPERERGKYALRDGDIVVARIGATTGKAFLIGDCPAAVFASYLIRLRMAQGLLPAYFSQFTATPIYWEQIDASKGGRLKLGVNIPVLSGLLVPLPPVEEQEGIAQTLEAADRKIEVEARRLSALDALFTTLLDHLMTGKVRVHELTPVLEAARAV